MIPYKSRVEVNKARIQKQRAGVTGNCIQSTQWLFVVSFFGSMVPMNWTKPVSFALKDSSTQPRTNVGVVART